MKRTIKKPVGEFLHDKGKNPMVTNDGFYYHYSEVCTLLKKYAEAQNKELRKSVERITKLYEQERDCNQMFKRKPTRSIKGNVLG